MDGFQSVQSAVALLFPHYQGIGNHKCFPESVRPRSLMELHYRSCLALVPCVLRFCSAVIYAAVLTGNQNHVLDSCIYGCFTSCRKPIPEGWWVGVGFSFPLPSSFFSPLPFPPSAKSDHGSGGACKLKKTKLKKLTWLCTDRWIHLESKSFS